MFLTLAIFIATLALVMVRPKPFNEATAAALGALVMLVIGIVSPAQAFDVLKTNANVLFFFLGLMLVSTVADHAGFFQWSATKAVQFSHGSSRWLLLIIIGIGTVITAFFSNDATALVLTPIVYALVIRLHLNPIPYVFACAFIANTASMLLPVSNPVNLLAVDQFRLGLGEYFHFLLLPSLLALMVIVALFLIIFRKDLLVKFTDTYHEIPFRPDSFFYFVCGGLGFTAGGYVVASIYRWPVSWPALAGGVVLLAGAFGLRRIRLTQIKKGISWSIFLFVFSLALLVRGLETTGVTTALGNALTEFASRGNLGAILVTVFGTAIGSNLINNWSMMMVSVTTLAGSAGGASHQSLVYASILGSDIGPNITILGALSSMLWLLLLKQRGLTIHPLSYLKLGLIIAPPMLILGALAIYGGTLF